MGLQLNWSGCGKWALFVEVVIELGLIDCQLVVQVDCDFISNQFDNEGVPFADGLVRMDEWLASGSAFRVVPESGGSFFGPVPPAASGLGGVPKLNLRNAAQVDSAVGLGIELELKAKFEVRVVFFGS